MKGVLLFRVAAGKLGMGTDDAAGRRLKRLVVAKERATGAAIAVRGDGNERPLRGVTMAALQQNMPELIPASLGANGDTKSALVAEARAYLAEFDERTRRVARGEAEAAIGELVQPQIDDLRSSNNQALELCRDIAQRLANTTPPHTSKTTIETRTDA